ncbi:MAG: tripartite tricarboxylate transporter permease, partial [Deltaproteobacteria bacterium]|nr:tripartite tricarboxylate transporter permease [Deltaproteobacteria bacterium]
AILIGALMMWGLQPGPTLVQQQPMLMCDFATISLLATVLSFMVSLVRAQTVAKAILQLPTHILYSSIILFCFVGTYALGNSFFDVGIMLACGVLGFVLKMKSYPLGPIVVGLILGGIMESNFKRALLVSDGSFFIFLKTPISFILLAVSALSVIFQGRMIRRMP